LLGVTGSKQVPATTVQAFNGNNISARGDLASRLLQVLLTADRPDPENRTFRHPDPIGWTKANRGNILRALYIVLRGNPRLYGRIPNQPHPPTRFKNWWHLVGSAVEHAAQQHAEHVALLAMDWHPTCPPGEISFSKMLLEAEADEEQTTSIALVLDTMRSKWTNGYKAADVASFTGEASVEAIAFKAALEGASGKLLPIVTATTVAWRLKALKDVPVKVGDDLLVLRYTADHHGGTFRVEKITIRG
jgi:hypothetical protein